MESATTNTQTSPLYQKKDGVITPKGIDYVLLLKCIKESHRKLGDFREIRKEFIEAYIGNNYRANQPNIRSVFNQMELDINTYLGVLAAQCPKVMISTGKQELIPVAAELELAINHRLKEIEFGNTFKRITLDAMFLLGIMKVGINKSRTVEIGGFLHDVGQTYAEVVDFDDFGFDMGATNSENIQFSYNRYRLPIQDVIDCGLFNDEWAKGLKPNKNSDMQDGEVKIKSLATGNDPVKEVFKEQIDLVDIWLPFEHRFITMAWDLDKPGRDIEWLGPDTGPYHLLYYHDVPNNIIPLSPASVWKDFHDAMQKLFDRMTADAKEQKSLLVFQGGAEGDVERILNAKHKEAIRMDNPGGTKEVKFGGVDQRTLAFAITMLDQHNRFNGNVDLIGGLGQQADTLGQEKIMDLNASKRVQGMQLTNLIFLEKFVRAFTWWEWNDPFLNVAIRKKIQGTDMEVSTILNQDSLEGDFLDYYIKVSPFSTQFQTPMQILQAVENIWTQDILPLAPILSQMGMAPNIKGHLMLKAKLLNIDEINDLIIIAPEMTQSPPGNPNGGAGNPPGMPPETTRNYVRQNQPSANVRGKNQAMVATLLGAGVQPNETAQIGRQ